MVLSFNVPWFLAAAWAMTLQDNLLHDHQVATIMVVTVMTHRSGVNTGSCQLSFSTVHRSTAREAHYTRHTERAAKKTLINSGWFPTVLKFITWLMQWKPCSEFRQGIVSWFAFSSTFTVRWHKPFKFPLCICMHQLIFLYASESTGTISCTCNQNILKVRQCFVIHLKQNLVKSLNYQ